jgi:hypothetical protein
MLAAVSRALGQLKALGAYRDAQRTVEADSKVVQAATSGVDAAGRVVTAALKGQAGAASTLRVADEALRNIAIAAYIGVGYGPPTPAPGDAASSASAAEQNVSNFGALTGNDAIYGSELLTLVGQQARRSVAAAKRKVAEAVAVTRRAHAGYGRAEAVLAKAEQALATAKGQVQLLAVQAAAPLDPPGAGSDPLPSGISSPTILGQPVLTAAELAGWFASTGEKARITVPIAQLAADYATAGKATGVRDDVAFAQSIVETGFFSFPSYGQVTPGDNNFAGIGACDSCKHGWRFQSAQKGVEAQLELLEAYASPTPVPTPLLGPVGVGGCCATWTSLAGTWASSLNYGVSILTVYDQMLLWALPRRVQSAGLAPRLG